MKVAIPEDDFRQLGQAFIRRKANDDIEGEQVIEIDRSDSQGREGGSDRRESLRDVPPSETLTTRQTTLRTTQRNLMVPSSGYALGKNRTVSTYERGVSGTRSLRDRLE